MSNKIVSAQPALAVVGVSALFPGSLEAGGFWRDIFAGRDLLTDVPSTHWLLEDFYDANPKAPDKTYAKRGGFLKDVPFDPMAFGVPPSILEATDTSQLLSLIVAQRVLEDATRGQFAQMDKSRVSVILGVTSGQELMGSMVGRLQRPVWQKALREAGLPESKVQEACERISKHYVPWQESSFPGLLGNVVAGRIANRFDLGGTNCVTDAACASAFSAVAMAAHELHLGLSDMVIAGGVDTMNDIFMFMCFSKTPALSASGDCRPFSDQADGTMLGEGLGMVALKRLEDAERDGDAIYAVLRGIGSSSDGRAKSVYAPVPEGQAKALRRAYEQAGYGPETVELVEAHGTGTKAGDAAEFEGLRQAFDGSGREDRQWCALGSVKSQIGHTKSAAGVAGLIKALFALRHKVLPPTIKVERPNPKLELERSPFYLNTEARPWVRPGDHPRRASVSSFGFGGSNFHITLEEYGGHAPLAARHRNGGAELVVLGADDASGLLAQLEALAAGGGEGFLAWLARDSQAKASAWAFEDKASFEHEKPNLRRVKKEGALLPAARLALWAEDEDDLRAKLAQAAARLRKAPSEAFALPGLDYALGAEAGQVALLFPGQGSQYLGMGAGVAMGWDQAAQVWDEVASLGWPQGERLDQVVFPRPSFSEQEREANKARVVRTEWAQPGIGAASLALLALLRRAGVGYDCVGGHSFGEVIALSAAGVLGPLDAMRVARKRGELMRDAAASTSGAMSAVVATVEQVREVLAQAQVGAKVANHNAPQQVVISGPTAQVEAAEVALQARGLRVKRLSVATAFHSEVVSASSEPFGAFLQGVEFGAAKVPVYANSEAAPYGVDAGAMRATLAGQIARPVRFVEQVEAMYAAGARVFVEVGPSAVLTGLVGSILGARPHKAVALDRQGADGAQVFLQGLGKLWVGGVAVDFVPLWGGFVEPVDPRTLPKPKMVVPINGSNYNKPYPPVGGASVLPGPNPEVEPEVVVREVIHEVVREVVKEVPVAVYTPSPAPVTGAEALGSSQAPVSAAPSAQVAASPAPVSAVAVTMSDPERLAWVGAFQEAQRQTAEVHASWQATMAQTHMAWLRSMETSFVGLSALVGGPAVQPAPVMAAPVAAPSFAPRAVAPAPVVAAPVVAAPAPVVAVAAPVMASPAPAAVAAPKPAPVVAAPVVAAPAPAAVVVPKPAPVAPVVAAPVAAASAGVDLQKLMLEVVSEKTGYPAEMLDLKMSLEADLGIDSIKRVEILSAMTERAPGLPEVDTSKMASLKTLGQIVEVMQAAGAGAAKPSNGKAGVAAPAAAKAAPVAAPVAAAVVAPAASAGVDLQKLMLEVVSEKTGYPAEMLDLKMSLEADLGIDSIKRVEILSAMTERAPGLPEVDTSKMASLKTLGQIVEVMQAASGGAKAAAPAAVAPAAVKAAPVAAPVVAAVAAPAAAAGVDLQKLMLEVVSEKTGYPAEMLDLKMSLEADLGIDSIKRVEILSAMTERAPGLPEVDTSKMASLKTLGQIVEVMQAASGGAPAKVEAQAQGGKSFLAEADPRLGRYVLDAVEAPALGFAVSRLVAGRVVVTSQGCEGVAEALVGELARFGVKAEAAATVPGDAEAVVFLGGLADGLEEPEAALRVQRSAFEAAKAVAGGFEAGRGVAFVTVQDTGGDFGLSGSSRAWVGGLPGLVKTAAQEWPRATCKALDVERGGRSAQELARVIAQELMAGGPESEVGLKADGRRLALKSFKKAVEGGAPAAGPSSVIVVSGGARGVTAATVVALAREARSKFVILGRTALGEEPAACRGVEGDAALKRALLEDTRARGVALNPAQLGEQVAAILANREVRATLAAIEAAGAQVRYVVADVADAASVKAGLAQVRQGWGPITGLIHGAGVLADRKIADKTPEQFDKVLRTKVGGLQALLEATQGDPLSLIVMFSSVAGRAGNVGQCDYAMANETLNKVAGSEAARRRSVCLVKSLGWGPWEGGMVTPALKARFEALGVALIPLKVGAQMLVDEVMRSDRGRVELVLGGPPKGEALLSSGASAPQAVFELAVDASRYAFLVDHSIQGVPVVPAVLVLEWFARAAKAMRPELSLVACRDLKVLQGIQLKNFGAGERFFVHIQAQDQGDKATLTLDVRDAQGHIRYTGLADLQPHPPTSSAHLQAPRLGAWDASKRLYGDVLFHGPDFQVIRAIEGFAQEGIVGLLDGVGARGWGGAWQSDSAALDGGLQLAVLWAREVLGGRSLPTRLVSYRPFFGGGEALPGPLRCVVRAKAQGASKVVCDLAFADVQGKLVVELQAELHVMPGQQLVW